MSRRVPLQNLRGSDPTLLEVQLQDLLRRPMGQLEPINVLDLIALADAEGRPRSVERSLALFIERIEASIVDLPIGPPWEEFLGELEGIDGHRVPHRFRQMLQREIERSDRLPERVAALLGKWEAEDPEPFRLGEKPVRVTRAIAVEPVEDAPEKRRPARAKAPSATPKAAKVVTEDDRERMDWIAETVLERVRGAGEKGLGEQVLIAGVRHRAKELYPTLTPIEITTVLRDLKESGRVRYSAGRWSAPARW